MTTPRLPLMVFAAGFGTRMRALTADRPKPMLTLGGRRLLDRALDFGRDAGAQPIAVNTHYLGQQIIDHLADQPDVAISDEAGEILETGGGLRRALPLLGQGPVMTLNPDGAFRGPNPLRLLAKAWRPEMEALLLVLPTARVHGRTSDKADFTIDGTGRIARADGAPGTLFIGAQILRTEGLGAIAETAFSLNRLWDGMIARGTAHGLIYPGSWCDVGSPEGLAAAEALLAEPA